MKKQFILHEDGCHGWLEVSYQDVTDLNIQNEISDYSYINRITEKIWQVYHANLSSDGTYGIKNIFLDTTGAQDAYSDYINVEQNVYQAGELIGHNYKYYDYQH